MNKKRTIYTILISFVIILSLGGTYAYLSWTTNSTQNTEVAFTVTQGYSCSANGGGNITSSSVTLIPTDCLDTAHAIKRTITVNGNTSIGTIYTNMWLNINNISSGLANSDNFRYALTTESNSCTTGIKSSGSFKNIVNNKVYLLNNLDFTSSGSKTYYLYIWLDEKEEDPSTMNQSFNLSLDGECSNEQSTLSGLYDTIQFSADKTTQIDFSKTNVEDGTNGVYTFTESGSNPVYYFRGGNNLSNNVLFANHCWQVVRTTETGGVKMIYNGEPSNGQCTNTSGESKQIGKSDFNQSDDDKKNVGYYYDEDGEQVPSTIATYIDDWYSGTGTMTGYTSYLEDTPYCNDRTERVLGSYTYFAPYDRIENSSSSSYMKPTLKCRNEDSFTVSSSKGNGVLTYPVGLLTADEAMISGLVSNISNSDNYLLGTGTMFWLSAPCIDHGNNVFNVYYDGSLGANYSGFEVGVRPVVSLKPGLEIENGTDGSSTNPYRIKEKHYLYDIIKNSAKTTQIDFTQNSSSDGSNGVYTFTESGSSPIYYFRGSHDGTEMKNNIIFGDYCWKIVRTTETGGVKIIYNGSPSNDQCNNTTGASTQITTKAFNSSYSSLADVGYYYGTRYAYNSSLKSSANYLFGSSVTYSGGTYTLNNTQTNADASHHYSCKSTTATTCSTVYYAYYGTSTYYSIALTGGKTVETAITEMLGNSYKGTMADYLEGTSGWYKTNIEDKELSSYLEDTPYCNDRSYNEDRYEASGWNPNGGSLGTYLYFNSYERVNSSGKNYGNPTLKCSNNDSFTKSNNIGNGKLTYPIGLLTADEAMLAGLTTSSQSTNYLYTNSAYWLSAPSGMYGILAYGYIVYSGGFLVSDSVSGASGARPVVSLKPGLEIEDGTEGTMGNPYRIKSET